ncbi:carboxymuconolactone decarboxylase family protein [Rhizobium sp. 21-4511-3d]
MIHFPIYTIDDAPDGSKQALGGLEQAFGFLPNVAGAMAASPVLLNSLAALFSNVHGGSFTERQIQILLLTNAVTNKAEWAIAFHSSLALSAGVLPADVDVIRDGRSPAEPEDAALSDLARALISKRGRLDEDDTVQFLQAGFDQRHLLEVIAVVAASAITNYTVNVTRPPLEERFRQYAWPKV